MSEQQPPPYGWYPPGQQYVPPGPPGGYQNGLGTAGMVLGIIALVLFWTIFVGIICGVLAIIFSLIGRGRANRGQATNGGQAVAGLVTGVIAVVFSIGFITLVVTSENSCVQFGTDTTSCSGN